MTSGFFRLWDRLGEIGLGRESLGEVGWGWVRLGEFQCWVRMSEDGWGLVRMGEVRRGWVIMVRLFEVCWVLVRLDKWPFICITLALQPLLLGSIQSGTSFEHVLVSSQFPHGQLVKGLSTRYAYRNIKKTIDQYG